MNENKTRAGELMDGYLDGELSAEQTTELFGYLQSEPAWVEELVVPRLKGFGEGMAMEEHTRTEMLETMLGAIRAQQEVERAEMPVIQAPRVHVIRRFRWVAAAIFILALAGVVFLLNPGKTDSATAQVQRDIQAPEKNRATITLPDGKTILLDTVPDGTLIAGVARKTADGQLVFEGKIADAGYLTASNPRNSKAMFIELPDHSRVWLNADTRLQYPTDFNVKEREVILSGEAYFEVVHNAAKPFRVSAGEQTIEDIGTAFNVKAYGDENAVKTTLLEGIVKINNTVSLKPGQQFSNNKITAANIDEAMAWKNGSFYLDGRELAAIAGELGRWYDVEIVFENPASKHNIVFGGEMGRNLTILETIELLKGMNLHCRLDGKKLVIE